MLFIYKSGVLVEKPLVNELFSENIFGEALACNDFRTRKPRDRRSSGVQVRKSLQTNDF